MFSNPLRMNRRECLQQAAAFLSAIAVAPQLMGQEPTRGFDQIAHSTASLTEQKRQRGLWVMEVQLKPMRMVWVDLPSPNGGDPQREQVWYLAYRAVNRQLPAPENDDTDAVNELDPVPQKPMFIPELTLVTYDDPARQEPVQVLRDIVLPPAVTQINLVESHRPGEPVLLDTVSVIQPVPDPAASPEEEQWIYGVATWRGVDPNTDYFKVVLSGFTNGYEKRDGENGQTELWRKVLVQKFARPGDRFDPNQAEFGFSGKAAWEYEADGGKDDVAQAAAGATGTRK